MTDRARITEVGPRDGLQNEPGTVPTAAKADLVRAAAASGVQEVEVTSFVHPRWVPQLADAADLLATLAADGPPVPMFSALVPNEAGLDRLLKANDAAGFPLIAKASVFTAASETFSQKNTNASIAETLERFRPVIARAHSAGLATRGYVSCVVACPYEGPIEPESVGDVAAGLLELGVDEIDLGDTIGEATADTISGAIYAVIERLDGRAVNENGEPTLTLHLHDTFGRAAECVLAAVDLGVRSFDASAAGLGGCPYASRPGSPAPGNIATATLVRTLEDAGIETGVHPAKLALASTIAERIVAAARLEAAADGKTDP